MTMTMHEIPTRDLQFDDLPHRRYLRCDLNVLPDEDFSDTEKPNRVVWYIMVQEGWEAIGGIMHSDEAREMEDRYRKELA